MLVTFEKLLSLVDLTPLEHYIQSNLDSVKNDMLDTRKVYLSFPYTDVSLLQLPSYITLIHINYLYWSKLTIKAFTFFESKKSKYTLQAGTFTLLQDAVVALPDKPALQPIDTLFEDEL